MSFLQRVGKAIDSYLDRIERAEAAYRREYGCEFCGGKPVCRYCGRCYNSNCNAGCIYCASRDRSTQA
jgi:hypothetical protein